MDRYQTVADGVVASLDRRTHLEGDHATGQVEDGISQT